MRKTSRNEELDEVLSLEIGADDFVSKPVRPRILLARIKAISASTEFPSH